MGECAHRPKRRGGSALGSRTYARSGACRSTPAPPWLGVSRTYLADVECGRRNVSLATLDSIARGLGVSLEELLKGV